jgi:hypothetical protein
VSASDGAGWNVARYLATRLQQLGIRYLYGVPGNHLGPFLTEMHARKLAEWVGTPTEMGAGYAADGYARIHGVGAVAVTYGVGAFSLINTVSGAYVEQVPLVAINASPKYEQWLTFRAVGVLTSHMSPRFESNLDAYRQVTVDAQVITNSRLAPAQIDGALTACLSERRPVYLEIMEDVWTSECEPPAGELKALERPVSPRIVEQAATAAVERIRQLGQPILWGGGDLGRAQTRIAIPRSTGRAQGVHDHGLVISGPGLPGISASQGLSRSQRDGRARHRHGGEEQELPPVKGPAAQAPARRHCWDGRAARHGAAILCAPWGGAGGVSCKECVKNPGEPVGRQTPSPVRKRWETVCDTPLH